MQSALDLINGEDLDEDRAAAAKFDGPPGFFLAALRDDAEYFAHRRVRGAIIRFELSATAMRKLRNAGAKLRPIPVRARSVKFDGEELFVPPNAFPVFNQLRRTGEIVVTS